MIVLVCGDREWTDRTALVAALDEEMRNVVEVDAECFVLIEGCARGADAMAEDWAALRGVPNVHFPADWSFGPKGGPLRNIAMLKGGPDKVIAFHENLSESKGTRHMVTIAKRAGIPVVLYPKENYL
jgi:hypothetical protein